MRCKHNILLHKKGEMFCYHCGMLIRDDKKCEKEVITKQTANTIMEADVHPQNQTEENTNTACRKHVLDINPGGETSMKITHNKEAIEFKSISPYFEKERDGFKCNTERIFLTQEEENLFVNSMFKLCLIGIRNKDTNEIFVRKITDISFAELGGVRLYIISWMHRAGEP